MSKPSVFVAEEAYDEETEKEIKLGADPVFVDEAPNGKERARFSNIWELDLIDGKNATENHRRKADHR